MKTKTSFCVLVLSSILLSSCVMPPLYNDVTARSLGRGNWSTEGGVTFPPIVGGYIKQSVGLTDNLNVGLNGEIGQNTILGGFAQYSIINHEQGLSLAVTSGGGGGRANDDFSITDTATVDNKITGYYGYVGTILSYKTEHFEPYLALRVNYLHLSNAMTTKYIDNSIDTFTDNQGSGVITAGTTLWVNNHIGLTANANTILSRGDDPVVYGNGGIVLRY